MAIRVNYLSYDGNSYRLEYLDTSRMKNPTIYNMAEFLDKSIMESSEIYNVGITDVERKVIFFKRVGAAENPHPIIRFGTDDCRCPYCKERQCLTKGKISISGYGNAPLGFIQKNGKTLGIKREVCKCVSPSFKEFLFILERRSEGAGLNMIRTEHCFICNAKKESLAFEVGFIKIGTKYQLQTIGKCKRCGLAEGGFADYTYDSDNLKCLECKSKNIEERQFAYSIFPMHKPLEKFKAFVCNDCKKVFFLILDK